MRASHLEGPKVIKIYLARVLRFWLTSYSLNFLHATKEEDLEDLAEIRPLWSYDPGQSFYCQSGSANNWARGYSLHGSQAWEAIEDKVRREIEHADAFGGLLVCFASGRTAPLCASTRC